jgi:hypothetical protein
MKTIYELELNEQLNSNGILITRVAGGWIYIINGSGPIFIKMDYEFEDIEFNFDLSPERVIEVCRKAYGFDKNFLDKKSRKGKLPQIKQIISKILYEKLKLDQYTISLYLRYGSRSSVTNAIKAINNELEYNKLLKERYLAILKQFKFN